MYKGKFITIEGCEGTGKSTQIKLLENSLKKEINVKSTREPGGSIGAEKIRKLIFNSENQDWSPITEALLHISARSDHLENIIKPNLKKGTWVICDRFRDSTTAYQSYGNNLKLDVLEIIQDSIFNKFNADLTIILDMNVNKFLKRVKKRKSGIKKYEKMSVDFHNKVRKGFLKIAQKNKKRCVVINAEMNKIEIKEKIINIINKKFKTNF
ncbi:MAG: Thymidylate kinase [Alphaproteobacteria bacterium MarineAlpha6_Bin3]|nr:MAG: Thymidylate kinase [Alphaproteobacteria bacterium MarineAlpha6_Bin3]|tara:strand:+ start:2555 stop:3187 length:633 start_codon:yes stop_codon:yes gene_type:complete